jgi:hypothetical protein
MMNDEFEDSGVFEQAKATARQMYSTMPLMDLIKAMDSVGKNKDAMAEEMKVINAHYDVLRLEVIPERMDSEGIENLRVEGIGRVSLTGDMFVGVKPGAREELYEWLKANRLGDLIQATVNASTLKSFVKRRIKDGNPYPTELLNVTPITRASITKK